MSLASSGDDGWRRGDCTDWTYAPPTSPRFFPAIYPHLDPCSPSPAALFRHYSSIYLDAARSHSVGTVFFGAFAFGLGYDTLTQRLWDNHNRGVSI